MERIRKQMFYLLFALFCLPINSMAKPKDSFTVLQLNLWEAGSHVPNGHQGIVDVLSEVNADVVFLCEIHGNRTVSKIVNDLKEKGIHYYGEAFDLNVGILSKFKPDSLIKCCTVPGNEIRTILKALITINGQPICFYSAHLDHQNYGCYLPRGYNADWSKAKCPITDESKVLETNRLSYRDESIRLFLQYVQADLQKGIPVVIGGDFNEPSYLDWQADTKDLLDHNGAVIHWDCSMMLCEAGFIDTFREQYPDPVLVPGITYPAGNKWAKLEELTWAPEADERERIDFIYYSPGDSKMSLKKSMLVGPNETVANNKIVETSFDKYIFTPKGMWPSDHKGNLVTFKIRRFKK